MATSRIIAVTLSILLAGAVTPDDERRSFQGCISYTTTVEPLLDSVTAEDVAYFGTAVKRCYDGSGNVWSEWTDAGAEWEIYVASENVLYTKMRNNDKVLFTFSGEREERELLSSTVEDSTETVLGRGLRLVTLRYSDDTHTNYWFDPSIYMDPAPFAKLKFAYGYRYAQLAKSPTLKYERHAIVWRMTQVATSIDPGELPAEKFVVPNMPTKPF